MSKSFKSIDSTISLVRRSKVQSLESCLKLFEALVSSVALYASEVWAFEHLDQLDRLYNHFCKRLFMLSRLTAGYIIRLETGYYRLRQMIIRRPVMYWLKILDMTENRFPAKCYQLLLNNHHAMTGSRPKLVKSLKQLLDNLGFSFLWQYQNAAMVRSYVPVLLQTLTDQMRCTDLTRLNNSSINAAYCALNPASTRMLYLDNNALSLHVQQLLFKLRLQSDNIYLDGRVYYFSADMECAFCARDSDTIKHFLKDCNFTCFLRNNDLQTLLNRFYSGHCNISNTEQCLKLYRYALFCFNLRHAT